MPNLIGFNGATAFQPWIRSRPVCICELAVGLQWGHSFSAVDTWNLDYKISDIYQLQWGHSFSAVDTGRLPGH